MRLMQRPRGGDVDAGMAGVRLKEPGGVHITSNTPITYAAVGTYAPSEAPWRGSASASGGAIGQDEGLQVVKGLLHVRVHGVAGAVRVP